ncbi:23663_t:CDS:2, partial [Dentiscutata erythropus]
GISNLNQTTNNPKNKKQKSAPIYKYFNILDDGTCVCKACDNNIGISKIEIYLLFSIFSQ